MSRGHSLIWAAAPACFFIALAIMVARSMRQTIIGYQQVPGMAHASALHHAPHRHPEYHMAHGPVVPGETDAMFLRSAAAGIVEGSYVVDSLERFFANAQNDKERTALPCTYHVILNEAAGSCVATP
jgi:hypothetical protein